MACTITRCYFHKFCMLYSILKILAIFMVQLKEFSAYPLVKSYFNNLRNDLSEIYVTILYYIGWICEDKNGGNV